MVCHNTFLFPTGGPWQDGFPEYQAPPHSVFIVSIPLTVPFWGGVSEEKGSKSVTQETSVCPFRDPSFTSEPTRMFFRRLTSFLRLRLGSNL